jgi:pimeloyl-ACP methyl ester carboxylesterase
MSFAKPIELEPAHWQHQAPRQLPIDVTAQLLSNANAIDTDQPALLIIPGYGEGEWAAKRVLRHFSKLGRKAIVSIADPSQVPASQLDLTTFATHFGAEVAAELQLRDELPTRTLALGHSMGGGLLGLALGEVPELFGPVGFLEPVGHDTAARKQLYPNVDERKRRFKRHFAQVVAGPYPHATPNELFHAGVAIGRQLLGDLLPRYESRFDSMIGLTVTEDAVPAVIAHAKAGNPVAYVLGKNDPLINESMIKWSFAFHGQTEQPENVSIALTDEKHAYIGWRSGGRHIDTALDLLAA